MDEKIIKRTCKKIYNILEMENFSYRDTMKLSATILCKIARDSGLPQESFDLFLKSMSKTYDILISQSYSQGDTE